eukprot:210327-Prorocentrum_lima.AAC.1
MHCVVFSCGGRHEGVWRDFFEFSLMESFLLHVGGRRGVRVFYLWTWRAFCAYGSRSEEVAVPGFSP